MLNPQRPALVLAPMEGITDAPMRALQSETGNFTYAVSEFLRVSIDALPLKVFRKEVPELEQGGVTAFGTPVQVQLLGGDPDLMAKSAIIACKAGALGIDINFGCPAPTVNRHDGGATLLKYPSRIRDIVGAVRRAVPSHIPVSAKLRLGWDHTEAIHQNAAMASQGGASWITIHARTRTQGYAPPVYWKPIGEVRKNADIPVIANGDIWTIDDFRRCQDETGCLHFMIGRSALSNPLLSYQISSDMGLTVERNLPIISWISLLESLLVRMEAAGSKSSSHSLKRLKQWLRLADHHGDFKHFDLIKRTETVADLFVLLAHALHNEPPNVTLNQRTLVGAVQS